MISFTTIYGAERAKTGSGSRCAVCWLTAFAFFAPLAHATESTPVLHLISAGPVERVPISIAGGLHPSPAFEVPPAIVQGAPEDFFVSTGWSWFCRASQPVTQAIRVDAHDCRRFSVPSRIDPTTGLDLAPAVAALRGTDWGRSYLGVYSAVRLPTPWRGYDTLAFLHGENKNERLGDRLYASTVDPSVDPHTCASGYAGRAYTDCPRAYNGLISARLLASRSPDVAPLDLGPIVWPTMPFRTRTAKLSNGLRHPSALVDGGYAYVFYTDTSQSDAPERRAGLHVARLLLPTDDEQAFGHAQVFAGGKFADPSLPQGFSAAHVRDFFASGGHPASGLWQDSWTAVRFAVARFAHCTAFLGVEEFSEGDRYEIRLRVSDDLVHWSDPVAIPHDSTRAGWSHGVMFYPVPVSSDGQASEVAPQGFLLLGAGLDGQSVLRQSISVDVDRCRASAPP